MSVVDSMRSKTGILVLAGLLLAFSCTLSFGQETPPRAKASVVRSVDLSDGRALLEADGEVDRFQSFSLNDPARLVVDVYGVKPGFAERTFNISSGFRKMRVGVYEDKTRFVFDTEGRGGLPPHELRREGARSLLLSWTSTAESAPAPKSDAPKTAASLKPAKSPVQAPVRVTVEGVDFRTEGAKSILTVDLSGVGEAVEPVSRQNVVRFGVLDASIPRALRRVIDTSSFPSVIQRIIPYTVLENGRQEVRFAVELKGEAPYALRQEGKRLTFEVENLHYAEAAPPAVEQVAIPVAVATAATAEAPAAAKSSSAPPATSERDIKERKALADVEAETLTAPGRYSGEKISLVFDDANIRSILQLIGEVSNLNIIAGEEIKGTITLRLIDVPWDQALDLIMETKSLGMLRDGNVVRILPKDKIRSMRQAELSAAREERQLEPLATEIVTVSYSDLGSIVAPVRDLLSDRGKVTADARNKQIIVTDVASVLGEVRRLVRILDTPERQVLIEARIVEATSNFSRDVGVKWGISHQPDSGKLSNVNVGLGGSFLIPPASVAGATGAGLGSGITFGRVGIDSTILDLRISALEASGLGKVVSTPRVTTLNGGKALISQGTKIPYQTTSDQGTKTEFENAELKLEVSPVINPDNSVILDIKASNSAVGAILPTGLSDAPSIDEKKAETKVLVRDGETTVIGGIFVEDERLSEAGVPLLGRIPILGHLFKSTTKTNERRELLIFITPRILN